MSIDNSKILTVSIAAYNVEAYIRNALDSLIDERVIDDLEILVVDDGGTDHTLEIVKEYAEKYPASIFPVHKANGGYGSVLNYTISRATGKYFRILDGDDWLKKENIYDWVQCLKKTDADLIFSPFQKVFQGQSKTKETDTCKNMPAGIYDFCDIKMNDILYMWCMTFKTSLLQKVPQKLQEHCLYTDNEFVSYPLPYIRKVYVCHTPIYMYRIGREDQSVSVKSRKRHYLEHFYMIKRLMDFQKTLSNDDLTVSQIIERLIVTKTVAHFNIRYRLGKEKVWDFYKEINDERPDIMRKALHESKLLRLFVYTRGLAYPLIIKILNRRG